MWDIDFYTAEQKLGKKLVFGLAGSILSVFTTVTVHFSYPTVSAPSATNNIT